MLEIKELEAAERALINDESSQVIGGLDEYAEYDFGGVKTPIGNPTTMQGKVDTETENGGTTYNYSDSIDSTWFLWTDVNPN